MCSYYFIHNELEVSLADARAVLDEAMESAGNLRRMQRKIIGYFPDEVDVKDMSSRPQRPRVWLWYGQGPLEFHSPVDA